MSQDHTIHSRYFEPGDEPQIESLFKTVFKQEQSYAEWKWKFIHSPYQKKYIHLSFNSKNELVGQFAASVVPLNFLGRKEWATQSVDSAILPEYRSLGLFVKSLLTSIDRMKEEGISVIYGFPNRMSLPIVLFKIGCSFHFELKHYHLPISQEFLDYLYNQLISRSQHESASSLIESGFRFADSKSRIDQLWSTIAPSEVCSFWKDFEYLNWRYLEHPHKRYQLTAFGNENALDALIVWQKKGDQAYVSEFLVRNKDVTTGRFALVEFLAHLKKEGVSHYVFPCGGDRFQEQVHQDLQWSSSKEMCFSTLSLKPGVRHLIDFPQNWTVVAGDSDVD
jgi:hypothetical protein